ncbi:AAA family ATPase [Aureliella helgolandensis]|uniref:Nuclease SbcCD subunit C n=1 Tax=Aureliella helgolandensis TaxID=2527968 RepID=A0A518G7R5_9BACT|nr:AAA family ATPase [Aureliella helgolandensis]QDV24631.1 Nuclease SbcCD subunit C [Aureliella helgolandensis]
MKFISLRMRNWRSFQGQHEIEFSVDPERPVTLLLGPNGAGKTALLNAFTWAIYGEFTEGFDHTDRLVNLAAAELDKSADAFVEIRLQHEEDEYSVRRSTNAQRQLTADNDLVVTRNGERAVEADIHRILPKPLKDLFFFPAETFSTASVLKGDNGREGTSFDVGRAIRSLLSGDIYQNASQDIRDAINSNTLKPPKRGHGQEAVDSARHQYEQAEADLNAIESRKDELPNLLSTATKQAAKAKSEAERYDPKEIQKWSLQNDRLNKSVDAAKELVQRADSIYMDLSRSSHLHLAQYACESAIRRLDLAETAGLMPPRIHESVLEKTLETGQCTLCRTPLTIQTRERIQMLRDRVGDAQIAVRGLEARSMLKQYLVRRESEVDRLRGEIEKLATELEIPSPAKDANFKILAAVARSCITVSNGLQRQARMDLDKFIAEANIERPADGRSPVEIAINAQNRVDTIDNELARIDSLVDSAKKSRDETFKNYKEKSGKSDEHKQKTIAIEILQHAKGYFDSARQGLEDFGREDFEKAINKTYSDLIAKPFTIKVDTDFSIRVQLTDSRETVPLSQSEKVLLLIAFLGAIARLAPHYEDIAKHNQQLSMTGTVATSKRTGFPVVLDAPTSPLDEEYEIEVVDALPNLLPQIIVPVSAKSVTVWERIADKVGKAYVMELTSSTASNRKVTWSGKDYVYSVNNADALPARTRIASLN